MLKIFPLVFRFQKIWTSTLSRWLMSANSFLKLNYIDLPELSSSVSTSTSPIWTDSVKSRGTVPLKNSNSECRERVKIVEYVKMHNHCFLFEYHHIETLLCLRSEAGLVIQATGRTEFEDGLKPGSPGGVLPDNPSIRTSSLVTPVL